MFRVIISSRAEKALDHLDQGLQRRIIQEVDALAMDPRQKPNVKKLTGSQFYRLRVGDYRIVYDLDARRRLLRIITLGHRKEVYR